ncbi:MAG: hypothetical protein LHW64_02665 [Candidatus Cloacimonetes bacterium]|jgi:hypothetical protein|nr:hypothetical protein [Candidatus Cloacimonadota bacterium]MCB5286691.1 hypothetical protein [Candidatus Cloacimonadota bacterium]MCK9184783.1 hypothetical protein [Candidatus Cloacimonadota bacterium]MCK9584537.1 hypothetical protein [Candidatus Cloacimonadota bacterium]MDY0229011.1 hypothetical protein [Candidatus Cloacimonadaceae bacterium]
MKAIKSIKPSNSIPVKEKAVIAAFIVKDQEKKERELRRDFIRQIGKNAAEKKIIMHTSK